MLLTIGIYSDVICPWCFIGKRRLEKALKLLGGRFETRVTWFPFQLNPGMPEEGMERAAYRIAKFGSLERSGELDAHVAAAGDEEDIPFVFEGILRTPNTLDAHRLIWLAGKKGHQDAVVEALFSGYFLKGKDIGDRSVLREIAASAGLMVADEEELFAGENGLAAVKEEEEKGRNLGIDSVPTFVINDKYLISGARYPETLVSAFIQVMEQEENDG
jgi:predicted DsbA family dithiol-disulfide isomerase